MKLKIRKLLFCFLFTCPFNLTPALFMCDISFTCIILVLVPHSHPGSEGLLQDTGLFSSSHLRHSQHCTGDNCSLRKQGQFYINYLDKHKDHKVVPCHVDLRRLRLAFGPLWHLLLPLSSRHFALNSHCWDKDQ